MTEADRAAEWELVKERVFPFFESLNVSLREKGLPEHIEPWDCEYWSSYGFSYSRLHYLRRIAAHLDLRGQLPPPCEDVSARL